MKIKIITVGTPHLSFAKQGIEEYSKRISRFADIQIIHVKENKDTDKKILNYIESDFCMLLDETGKQHSSRSFAEFLEKQKPGAGNEIQLTDAIASLMKVETVEAFHMSGRVHDCGDKMGYLKAIVEYAMRDDTLGEEFTKFVKSL